MSQVPAWKRIGLQVKTEVESDPLNTTTHLEHDTITNKLAKKLNKKRKLEDSKSDSSQKKPPKRVKLPKLERKPPPEKDQLAYLRQYVDDKDNWKFSKQKQNWILKNISEVPAQYEDALVVYVEGLQGGARDRLVPELKKVVESWNEVAQEIEDRVNAELYGEKKEETEEKEQKEEEKTGPLREHALRCKKLLNVLLDEEIVLKGADVEEKSEKEELTEEKEEMEEEKEEEKEDKEDSDNLIIEDIEVEEYQYSTQEEGDAETKSESVSEKKEKKEKKQKSEKKQTPPQETKETVKDKKDKKQKKDKKSKKKTKSA